MTHMHRFGQEEEGGINMDHAAPSVKLATIPHKNVSECNEPVLYAVTAAL